MKHITPVIHVVDRRQTFRNIEIAMSCGAFGVFLISHGTMNAEELIALAQKAKKKYAHIWIGVNCLDLDAKEVASIMPPEIDAIWTDNAEVDERQDTQPFAEKVFEIFKTRLPKTLYFGGVAFKYQRTVSDLETAVEKASPLMDVVCTSGIGTGHAADVDKIKRMSGIAPLAIASGVTPENITDYLPYVDWYLVATGISDNFTDINPDKLKALIENVNKWEQNNA